MELVQKLRCGDEGAFIEIVDEYKKKIISFCYNYTLNYQDAEDLSQEIFIKLFNNMQRFREECSLKTYLYRIAVSACLDYKRRNKLKRVLSGLLTFRKNTIEEFEEKDYIRECVQALPKEWKVVVILYYYHGLSQSEIAAILNISAKAVEGRIYRAKQKLKLGLNEGGSTYGEKVGRY